MNAPALSLLLMQAGGCVAAVLQGRSLAERLPQVPSGLRPGVQALVFQAMRRLGTARALTRVLYQRPPPLPVLALVQTALALLMDDPAEDAQEMAYTPHTVVDQTVDAAKSQRATQAFAGLINAGLRRFLRERTALMDEARRGLEGRWNHPVWWVQRLQADHPAHWQAVLEANQVPGPLCLRVNRRRIDASAYSERLAREGLDHTRVGEDGVVLHRPLPVDRVPGFAEGWVSVQDAAAQRAAGLLLGGLPTSAKRRRVLDACAAPGGKTAHLLERADLDLWALDQDAGRCERIHDNLRRLGLQATVRVADAGAPADWWDGRPFDAILLDAPCSASGIVRRHPDVRWLRRAEDLSRLAQAQRRLLDALWPLLAPGGRLLYATCSVFRAEGEGPVRGFVAAHPDAIWCPGDGHRWPGGGADINDNAAGGEDGFFYARLDKRRP